MKLIRNLLLQDMLPRANSDFAVALILFVKLVSYFVARSDVVFLPVYSEAVLCLEKIIYLCNLPMWSTSGI